MLPLHDLLLFAAAALVVALTPGPNMIYVLSRSLCQDRGAGLLSLFGVVVDFLVHMFAAAVGLTAVFLAIPLAYEVLKWLGAGYLAWLAWQAVKPGARSPFEARELPPDSPRRLFLMGFLTNLLNPKITIFFTSLLPQFVGGHGTPTDLLLLGALFNIMGVVWLLGYAVVASRARAALARPAVKRTLDRITGTVLIGLGVRLALQHRR